MTRDDSGLVPGGRRGSVCFERSAAGLRLGGDPRVPLRDGPASEGGHPRDAGRLSGAARRTRDLDGLSSDAPELELSRLLDEYRTAREERHAHTSSKAQAAAGLLVVGLQQRLLSSVEAFARSLAVHRRTVERHWEQGRPRPRRVRNSPRLPGRDSRADPKVSGRPLMRHTTSSSRRPRPTMIAANRRPISSRPRKKPRSRRPPWLRSRDRRPIPVQYRRSCGNGSSSYSTGCRRSPTGLATSRTRRRAG